jgi:hypothetical protein
VSVDPPSHNKTMVEKLDLPFTLLSDSRGNLTKRCDLWNDKEGVAVPAIVVVDRAGVIRYFYAGHDFADRSGNDEVIGALDELSDASPGEWDGAVDIRIPAEEKPKPRRVHPDRTPITLEQLSPYYRGVFFVTVALKRRFGELKVKDRVAFKEADRYQQMAKEYAAAINETRDLKDGS